MQKQITYHSLFCHTQPVTTSVTLATYTTSDNFSAARLYVHSPILVPIHWTPSVSLALAPLARMILSSIVNDIMLGIVGYSM